MDVGPLPWQPRARPEHSGGGRRAVCARLPAPGYVGVPLHRFVTSIVVTLHNVVPSGSYVRNHIPNPCLLTSDLAPFCLLLRNGILFTTGQLDIYD